MQVAILASALTVLPSALAAEPAALVIARGPCELLPAFSGFGERASVRGDLPSAGDLTASGPTALALCSFDYPQPTRLSRAHVEALEGFVARGGRAYVEFAVPEGGGRLFGIELPGEPRRALYERLYVSGDLGPESTLKPGDILEEHNSACLVPGELPAGARVLLTYGRLIGTYQVAEFQPGYAVTVDLGEVRTVDRASQRYGAGQPNYYPERVELWLGEDLDHMRRVAEREEAPLGPVVWFEVGGVQARYVRLVCGKYRRSPVTDFLFMGEIEVTDQEGRNVVLHRPYTLSPPAPSGGYGDSGRKLTDGVVDGPYADGLSAGWVTEEPGRWEQWPALIEVSFGKGMALVALSKFSDFRARECRLTERWEGLMRRIALALVPPEERAEVATRHVPLDCWTEPRTWAPMGTPVTLVVRTAPGARVRATLDGDKALALASDKAGVEQASLSPAAGEHRITVVAETDSGRAERTVELRVSSRDQAYRRALDRNMQWFRRSGVLPKADGSAGVWSQRCLAWFDGGPDEFLASPFRLDCNAATAQTACLYGQLRGSDEWRQIAVNIARSMLPHQYADAVRPCFGGWPWLYENCDAIFFWDDNTRVAVGLLWLYTQTSDEEFLRAGLRTMELCREVAQEDGTIARHCIGAGQLDQLGREGFRDLPPEGLAIDFDLKRWAWAYGVTGNVEYKGLLDRVIDVWGDRAGMRGLPYAVRFGNGPKLRERLASQWKEFLRDPDVIRYGAPRAGAGDYASAYVGDCSITTAADDPLTDQLYVTPHLLLQALWGYQASGEEACLEAFRQLGDYLVRIQSESADPRIDGAWMRGFDFERWEYYGAPYDPAYGPYSAYTGWMNAFAAAAFAQYLMKAEALPPISPRSPRAAEVLTEVRAERRVGAWPVNVARGARYELTPAPNGTYDDRGGELTDGVLDGGYEDGRSVGWYIPERGDVRVEVTVDLGQERRVTAVSQRYGAGQASYCPDRTEVWAWADREHLAKVATVSRDGAGPGARHIAFEAPVTARYLRFVLTKRRVDAWTDFLFVGETEACG